MKILVSGGKGRFASELMSKSEGFGHHMVCVGREEMDVSNKISLERALLKYEPDVFVHCAAILDGSNLPLILEINIIGTANVVQVCREHNVKLIYISTDHVYSKNEQDHREDSPLLPFNVYGWTKLGGECAVRTYSNSLIIRGAFCVRPYPHQRAYTDVRKNMIYQDRAAEYILRVLDQHGVINLGESSDCSLYDFARRTRNDVQPEESMPDYEPKYSHLSVERLQRVIER